MNNIVEHRPWGSFEKFDLEGVVSIKVIQVNPNKRLSLQYHLRRDEYWKILYGNPVVTVDNKQFQARPGMEFYIKRGTNHRIMCEDDQAIFLELCYGIFDEEDIIRVSDDYGRV